MDCIPLGRVLGRRGCHGALGALLLGFLFRRQKGWLLFGVLIGMWVGTAFSPASHYLRYYMFLPLTMAAINGMLLPVVRDRFQETSAKPSHVAPS